VPVERRSNAEIVIDLPAGPAGKREPARREPVQPTAPRSGAGGIGGTAGTATDSAGDTQAPPGRTRRIVGLGVAGAGALTMGIAGIVTLGARSDYRKALDAHCQGATDMCNDEGLSITHGALHRANVATVFTLLGLGAVATGAVLYVTAPRAARAIEHAYYLAPAVGADGGALVFGGAF
jgi:hypothetical protein